MHPSFKSLAHPKLMWLIFHCMPHTWVYAITRALCFIMEKKRVYMWTEHAAIKRHWASRKFAVSRCHTWQISFKQPRVEFKHGHTGRKWVSFLDDRRVGIYLHSCILSVVWVIGSNVSVLEWLYVYSALTNCSFLLLKYKERPISLLSVLSLSFIWWWQLFVAVDLLDWLLVWMQ